MYVARPLRDAYKEGRKEGREEGRQEGIEEGVLKGFEEGIVKGREEAKYEFVDRLVAEGTFTAEKACEILDVDYSEYCNRENTGCVK